MDSTWLSNGGRLESYVVWGALVFFALFETFHPLRAHKISTPRRWLNHGILFTLNTLLNVVVFRGGAVVFALLVSQKGYGVLDRFIPFYSLRFVIGFVATDLIHFTSHYIYHQVPFLWRIHRVHHTDPDFDVTTGFRFHPLESLLTQSLNFGMIALLGPPAMSVLAAEAVTLFQDIFEHANVEMPPALDRVLMPLLISPSIHRIHHSTLAAHHNCNFGTIFPWWDRLFGTYAQRPSVELKEMETGLVGYPEQHSASIFHTLAAPLESETGPTASST